MFTKLDTIDKDAGHASPDEAIVEYTAYYTAENGAEVAVSYYVKEHDATKTNMPYDPETNYPRNEDGDKVLYSVEEVNWFTPCDDPDAAECEYGEGSGFWYWTLADADAEAQRLASIDDSDAFTWDGSALALTSR